MQWHNGDTDVFQSSSLLADGHYGPDEDLQAAGRTHAHAQCFAPAWIDVGAVVQRRPVHLNEDVGQDELQPAAERNTVISEKDRGGRHRNAPEGREGTRIECQLLLLNYSQMCLWRFQHSWPRFKNTDVILEPLMEILAQSSNELSHLSALHGFNFSVIWLGIFD